MRKKGEWFFRGTVILSIIAHGILLAYQTGEKASTEGRLIRIPVMLEEEPPLPPPPPPPPPKKEEPPTPKARPKQLAKRIKQVVEGDGLRSGELVNAELGNYDTEMEEPLPPPPPPEIKTVPKPKPKPKPTPKVNRVQLAREYLGRIRAALMTHKEYPMVAQRMGITGSATVSFSIESNSTFTHIAIRRSSGHEILDKAAMATVKNQSGQHQRPKALADAPLKTSVALRYEIQR